MADDFCERYGDLLTGSYDCVDRIVLNAYFPLGHNPGGFRFWWRRLHDGPDDQLDEVRRSQATGVIGNIAKKRACVSHYSFHIMDPAWGHVTIKMSGHPPFPAQVMRSDAGGVVNLPARGGIGG